MRKRLQWLFPSIYRLIVMICVSLGLSGLTNIYWGIGAFILALLLEVFFHVSSGVRMLEWLASDEVRNVPPSRSALWREIFSRVSESRKALVKNTNRLEERERRYLKTLSAIPEGIILVKHDWVLNWWNARAEQFFGFQGERHVGRHLLGLIEDPEFVAYVRGGKYEVPLIWQREGSRQRLEIRIVIADHKSALILARDVTEQERLHAMRRDFVANVSHELRTPLTVLGGFIEMAMQGAQMNAEIKPQHLKLMRDQAERMQRLVDDLLTLSRLEMSDDTKEPELIAVDELVRTITTEMRIVTKDTHTLECDVEPATLLGFKDEMRSAVVNLMTNAARYTPTGGTIRATCRMTRDGEVCVSVSDNGIGIAKDDIPRLTERFYRVDKSRSRETGGTGLGLAIVKHVLMHHKGKLNIESELGKGSCFTLILPANAGFDVDAANGR